MKKIILTIVIAVFSFIANAQNNNVGIGTTSPDASAKLDVVSTSKGFLPPRMTTVQRDAISNPATGLTIYNITDTCLQINLGTPTTPNWQCLSMSGSSALAGPLDSDGDGVSDDTDSAPNDPCVPAQAAGYTGYDMTNAIWYHSDCDGDGDENGTEVANGSDPYNATYTMTSDQDGDGVVDIDDSAPNDPCSPAQSAGYTGYDPSNTTWQADDCDGDGETNGLEESNGSDPYNAAETSLDTDGDGLFDWADSAPTDPCSPTQSAGYTGYHNDNLVWYNADCDGDNVINGTEDTSGSDPYDPNFTPTSDQDGDGIIDVNDSAINDPCTPTQSAGYTGYDATNTTWANADCDGDGRTNGTEATDGTDPYNTEVVAFSWDLDCPNYVSCSGSVDCNSEYPVLWGGGSVLGLSTEAVGWNLNLPTGNYVIKVTYGGAKYSSYGPNLESFEVSVSACKAGEYSLPGVSPTYYAGRGSSYDNGTEEQIINEFVTNSVTHNGTIPYLSLRGIQGSYAVWIVKSVYIYQL